MQLHSQIELQLEHFMTLVKMFEQPFGSFMNFLQSPN